METIVKVIIKVATLLTTFALGALSVYSLVNHLPFLATFVGFMLTAIVGFFTFLDIRAYIKTGQL